MTQDSKDQGRWEWIHQRLETLRTDHLLRERLPREAVRGQGRLRFKQGRNTLVNFGSNDYLGLSDLRASGDPGFHEMNVAGSGASPLVSGFAPAHAELERLLADFEQTEAALLFPTGYAANMAVMSTLPEEGDLILSDALNHASIIDGCRLSRAERFIYPHLDVSAIKALLQLHRHRYRRAFLVTESLFSMDGDVAPLESIVDLAAQFDVVTVVDEAHATGVFGETGTGLCEELKIHSRIDLHVGTLSKAIGALGGFVAADEAVVKYLVNRARPYIYSTAMPEALAKTAIENIDRMRDTPALRERLASRARQLREGLKLKGSMLDPIASRSPILPVIVGASELALQRASELRSAGFFVPAIRPPTVPLNTARLRISISAGHTETEIDALIASLVTS